MKNRKNFSFIVIASTALLFLALFVLVNSVKEKQYRSADAKSVNKNAIDYIVGVGGVENAKFDLKLELFEDGQEKIKLIAFSTDPESRVDKFVLKSGDIYWSKHHIEGVARVWYREKDEPIEQNVVIQTVDGDDLSSDHVFPDSFWVMIWDRDDHYFDPFGDDTVISGYIDHK